ncbi:hypothetical protein [Metapseudomonas otitidis]|uniref:hypothetical protein n=1 Tax=Metapseudomonas otitidis TaxID=319939 RepID=UPI001CA3FDF7|nr:hypothetical protein [Pseudomonas otitidis]QZX85370.1 hypothetical protein K6751_11935 [Pseudomonas otitidis]
MRLGIIIGIILGAVSTIFIFLAFFSFYDVGKKLMSADNIAFFKDIIGPLAAGLGGAAAGAVMSVYAQKINEKDKELDKLVLDYNSGVTNLLSQLNEMYTFREIAIVPFQNDFMRFISIPALPLGGESRANSQAMLNPVLLELDCADLLNEVAMCEARYLACLQNLKQRDRLYEECRQKIADDESLFVSLFDLKNQLGPKRLKNLYVATEGYIKVLDESIFKHQELLKRLSGEAIPRLKAKRPDRPLIKTDIMEGANLDPLSPPVFASAAELMAAVDAADSPRALAVRTWQPKPYGH